MPGKLNINELIEKHSSEIKGRIDGAVEAYFLLAGWDGAECDCGHPSCKKCRDTKEARELIRKAHEPLPQTNLRQAFIELLEMVKVDYHEACRDEAAKQGKAADYLPLESDSMDSINKALDQLGK